MRLPSCHYHTEAIQFAQRTVYIHYILTISKLPQMNIAILNDVYRFYMAAPALFHVLHVVCTRCSLQCCTTKTDSFFTLVHLNLSQIRIRQSQ